MKILALDLSLSSPGFSILEVHEGKIMVSDVTSIQTNKSKTQNYRLFQIFVHLKQIFDRNPDITAVVREKGFSRFPSVTQILFRVVGVSDVCTIIHGGIDTITELAPTTVKKQITGNGRATKDEVAESLSTYVGTDIKFNNDDESDSVAVGVTYLLKNGLIK